MEISSALVVGLGEIGNPLANVLESKHKVWRKDLESLSIDESVDVMHVCYPYTDPSFINVTVDYCQEFDPGLVVIHSTVVPGTTRSVAERSSVPVTYSAVRGKHRRMQQDLLAYTKFVAGVTDGAASFAVDHFESVGMKTEVISSPETLELAKLLETSYFGILLAWAQEIDRYCTHLGVEYSETMQFMREVNYLPPVVFQPGFIGGHCVIPNSHLLDELRSSPFMQLMRDSNDIVEAEYIKQGRDLGERVAPLPRKSVEH